MVLLLSDIPTRAATTVCQVFSGCTASSTLTGILKGAGTNPVQTAVPGVDYQGPITLTTTGTSGSATFNGATLNVPQYPSFSYPFTPTAYGGATSTTIGFLSGLFATASSTFSGPLHLSSLSNGSLAVYGGLVTSGATTTAGTGLTYSGNSFNCNTASGSVFGCLTAADWTTFNGKQSAGNYVTALTGDVTASGPGSAAATLATVNANIGSFTNASITVNGKGLITAASNGTVAPAFPFTPVSYGNATSTTIGFLNGLLSTASSTFTGNTHFPSGIWNSSGSVGIATTSPSRALSVGDDSIYSAYFSGRVGIGISAPANLFQVNGDRKSVV